MFSSLLLANSIPIGEIQRWDLFSSEKGMSAIIELVTTTLLINLLFFTASRMFNVLQTAGWMKKASWSLGGGIRLLIRAKQSGSHRRHRELRV